MLTEYKTASVGILVILLSIVLLQYQHSPSHLQTVLNTEASYRNGYYPQNGYVQVPYWYMTLKGCSLTLLEIDPTPALFDPANPWEDKYTALSEERPCNAAHYYLQGPGLLLALFGIFLIAVNGVERFFVRTPNTTEDINRQKKYIRRFLFTVISMFILDAAMLISILVMALSWGMDDNFNKLTYGLSVTALIGCPLLYLMLVRFGWGMHKKNFKKIAVLGFVFPLPLIYVLLLAF